MHRYRLFLFMIAFPLLLVGLVSFVSHATAMPGASHGAQPVNQDSPLGTNLRAVTDRSSDWPFVDAFKRSSPWIRHCGGQAPACQTHPIDLDEHGWVRSLPDPADPNVFRALGAQLFHGLQGHYPAGQYIVLYEGEGTILYDGDVITNVVTHPGRHVLDVEPTDEGIYLFIRQTDPNHTGNYIRNIQVIMPGFAETYATQIFHPLFLEKLQPYKALRFMDWMRTNYPTPTVAAGYPTQGIWAERPQVTDARYSTDAGVPLEMMIALSNRLHADPWFAMPHQANDEYITQFATLVRATLDAERKLYVQFSNEVWNRQFGQSGWVTAQAVDRWPDSTEDARILRDYWFGKRTAEMCDIWKSVWGAASERVICVMGARAANPATAADALACPLWTEGAPCASHQIDALAIAPYVGGYLGSPLYAAQVVSWTVDADGGLDKLFTELTTGGMLTGGPTESALQQAYTNIETHLAVADQYNLPLIAYEGGQHLAGFGGVENNAAITHLFTSANRDVRMGALYTQYLNQWKALGGQLFVHHTNIGVYNNVGSFGALEYLDQAGSPKYDALINFIQNNPCWWLGCSGVATSTPTATLTPTPTFTPTPTMIPTATASAGEPLQIVGRRPSGYFGQAITAGDVNGDGAEDLIISADYVTVGSPRAGEVYLLPGPLGWGQTITVPQGVALTIQGAVEDSRLGTLLASGDFNGDGYADIVLSTWSVSRTHVYLGSPTLAVEQPITITASAETMGMTIDNTRGGFVVCNLNGDGYDDLFGRDVLGQNLSAGYQMWGVLGRAMISTTLPLTRDVELDQVDVTITGIDLHTGSTGGSTENLACGDVDGDGYQDLIIGAPGASPNGKREAGSVYIIRGSPQITHTQAVTIQAPLEAGAIINGIDGTETNPFFQGDGLGRSVAVAEVNGDQRADLIIAAPGSGGQAHDMVIAGEVSLWVGRPLHGQQVRIDAEAAWTVYGYGWLSQLGRTLAAADLDGDGKAEVVLNCDACVGTPGVGRVFGWYLFDGDQLEGAHIITALAGRPDVHFASDGLRTLGTVDLDNNGRAEVVLASSYLHGDMVRVLPNPTSTRQYLPISFRGAE